LAEGANDPTKLLTAHGALGLELFASGEIAGALNHFQQAGPRLDWSRTGSLVFYPSLGAWALWAAGHSDQALEWNREALAASEALSPGLLANAMAMTATLHAFMRDPRMARQCAEAAMAMSAEHGFPFEIANGSFIRGWAVACEGHPEEGVAEMRAASADFEALGFVRARWFAFLAEACGKLEGPGAGLKLIDEGLALVQFIGDRNYEAELHRLKGELLLMQSAADASEAESCFRTGMEVARRQGGKALELRATTSLARLLRDTNRRGEALATLAEIYNWFTEGFDTADLKDAKALLDELTN
jgi:adenylate cyclase